MRYDVVVWDWNGTLLDDMEICLEVICGMLRRRGLPGLADMEAYRAVFGFPVDGYYRRAGLDLEKESFSDMAVEFMDAYMAKSGSCPLRKGALPALERMHRAGIKQMVLSASETGILAGQVAAQGVRGYMDRLMGLDNIHAASKEKIGVEFIARSGFAPHRVLLIGDTEHDSAVARAMGCPCVLMAGGHQSTQTLSATGAPVAEDFRALNTFVF